MTFLNYVTHRIMEKIEMFNLVALMDRNDLRVFDHYVMDYIERNHVFSVHKRTIECLIRIQIRKMVRIMIN